MRLHMSGALTLLSLGQKMHSDHMAMVARGASVHRSHWTVASENQLLASYLP